MVVQLGGGNDCINTVVPYMDGLYYDFRPTVRIGQEDVLKLNDELPPHLNTPHAISSQTEPYFWGPASVALDDERRLYVVETARHRIQVYQME